MNTLKTMWGNRPVTLTWVPSSEVPDECEVTSTHGFCFQGDRVVLVNIDSRGWDFPGGHMEANETVEECFAREVMEEACLSGSARMLGYVLVDNREDPEWDESRYPAIGCQVFYRLDVNQVHYFNGNYESSERSCFRPDEVASYHGNWNAIYDEILALAVDTEAIKV